MGVRGTSVLGFAAIIITVEEDEVEGRRRRGGRKRECAWQKANHALRNLSWSFQLGPELLSWHFSSS